MATKQEQEAFIRKIAPHIILYAKQFGVLTPSAVIAQACHETGYGVGKGAEIKVAHNNLFGLKYRPNRVDCNSGFFCDGSYEEYQKGVYTPINTDWYAFKNVADGCKGYFEFCYKHTDHYKCCLGVTDSYEYLKRLKGLSYATGSNYAEHVYQKVIEHNLTRFDPKPASMNKNDLPEIIQFHGTKWLTAAPDRELKYIVIHYTASTTSKAGSSRNDATGWTNSVKDASADFIVDDQLITQYNPDIENIYSHHCGGNKQDTRGGSLYGKCKNNNSIGIEMRSCNITGKSTKANDNNWYFTQPTVQNTIDLVKYLMKKYNIPASNIVRHFDVTGKWCPGVYGWNEDTGNVDKWLEFKNLISR